jgi:hypothetical protein
MRRVSSFAICVVAVLLAVNVCAAVEIVVSASDQRWTRELAPTTTYDANNDDMSTFAYDNSNPGGDPLYEERGARNGAVTFDLSGVTVPITSAYLRFFDHTGGGHNPEFQMTAQLLSPTNVSSITWNNQSTSFTHTALDSLGSLSLNYETGNNGSWHWYDAAYGSAGDVAKLEAARIGSGSKVAMMFVASVGGRDWGRDGTNGNALEPVQLVLNSVPEPSTCVLMVAGLISLLCYAWRKRK